MSPIISLSLLLLNLPVFWMIKKQIFPESATWQQALSLSHPPEMNQIILSGDWRELLKHLHLAYFSLTCAAVFLIQYAVLQLAFRLL